LASSPSGGFCYRQLSAERSRPLKQQRNNN
jgi:hypothetical protein